MGIDPGTGIQSGYVIYVWPESLLSRLLRYRKRIAGEQVFSRETDLNHIYKNIRFFLIISGLALLSSVSLAVAEETAFSQEQLDQMLAPIALYPDSLLSQIFMATTYPADVTEAVTWSKNNSGAKGDDAVQQVQNESWDPSVMSLVAFPQVLEMMGQQPDWVRNLGDAFLASPEDVMDTAQSLRKKARDEGNLKTTEQQTVTIEEPSSSETIIIIEPADPQVVYVPVYNPTVVYGAWWWPRYTPYYYHPVGYGIARGIGFGIGIGITRALWGGCRWGYGRGSVNINVNRYNNINVSKNRISGNGNSSWKHNAKNRKGVPYRDSKTRNKFDRKVGGADKRQDFRGREGDRNKARSALKDRGMDPAKNRKDLQGQGGKQARDAVSKANRDRGGFQNKDRSRDIGSRDKAGSGRDLAGGRDGAGSKDRDIGGIRDRAASKNRDGGGSRDRTASGSRDKSRDLGGSSNRSSPTRQRSSSSALSGAGKGNMSRQSSSRGRSSMGSRGSRGGGGRRGR